MTCSEVPCSDKHYARGMCRRHYMKHWHKTPAGKARRKRQGNDPEYQRQYRYNLKPGEYDALLLAQGGLCAICRADTPGIRTRSFYVDHDHDTGRVRGLLCHRCNSALGYLNDDSALLAKAVHYLETHG